MNYNLPTPALVVNLAVLRQNIEFMSNKAREFGVRLRPHIKTHKSKRIAALQMAAGAVGITCAKISEAFVMAEAGIEDIFKAYPTVGDYQLNKAMELAEKCKLTLAFDSVFGATKINHYAELSGRHINLSMIINTGGNRDGVTPDEALSLAKQVADLPHISLTGIMTHEGHLSGSRDREELTNAAIRAAEEMVKLANVLREHGIQIETVSTGTTPGSYADVSVPGITEWRPGTYVFNDVKQNLFFTSEQDCALTILATVVSNPAPNRYVLDAGSKVLSETYHPLFGHGQIKGVAGVTIDRLSEEHGVIVSEKVSFPIGSTVEIIPIHVCPVINLAEYFYVIDGSETEKWTVDARGNVV